MPARYGLAAAGALALFCGTFQAHAFCLTHGCSDKTEDCTPDANGCVQNGPLLHWASSCVSFDVQRDGSPLRGIDYADAHRVIVAGFAEWLNADCGGGLGPFITVSDFGPVVCHTAEYSQYAPNANIVMFRDDAWPYENAIDTLALTTLIFNADNGELYDADVEVNTFQSAPPPAAPVQWVTSGQVGRTQIDFASVITHEIGHFLGLSHSSAFGATMQPSYRVGDSSLSSIEQDDIDGICAALPPSRATSSSSCDPRHGFSTDCAPPEIPETTWPNFKCELTPNSPGALGGLLLAALAVSSKLLRRRLRPSARRL